MCVERISRPYQCGISALPVRDAQVTRRLQAERLHKIDVPS
ncbi:hypothetical protein SynMITS9220_02875 [Synechococcus sp. MIT S9220]|nr:hypothetical protein SynMITS9220_02875 [Synechococcus sp. MIT S9220]